MALVDEPRTTAWEMDGYYQFHRADCETLAREPGPFPCDCGGLAGVVDRIAAAIAAHATDDSDVSDAYRHAAMIAAGTV